MRILHLDAGKELRGGQWQVLRLIDGLASRGVESTLLAHPGSPLFDAARKRGSCVQALSLPRAMALARNHDLVHAHDAHSHTLAAIGPLRPFIVSRRVAFSIGTHLSSRWKYRRAAHYLAVSQFVRSVLMQGGVPPEKISVVPDGVPLLDPSSGTVILAIQKDSTLATEAAAIAGATIRIATDLENDLRSAAILVYITESEGLGSGVLLAMSAGVSVIASKIGGLPEIVAHGENGLLVDNTSESIAAAIRELKADPGLARGLAAAGRKTIEERFTVARMVERTMEIYRKVLV